MLFLKVYESFKSTNAGNTVSTCMWHVFWTSLISPSGSRQQPASGKLEKRGLYHVEEGA